MRTLVVTHHMKIHQNPLPLLWLIQPNHFLRERERRERESNRERTQLTLKERERERERETDRERGWESRELTLAAITFPVGTCLILKTSPVIPLPSLPRLSISLSVNLYVCNHKCQWCKRVENAHIHTIIWVCISIIFLPFRQILVSPFVPWSTQASSPAQDQGWEWRMGIETQQGKRNLYEIYYASL